MSANRKRPPLRCQWQSAGGNYLHKGPAAGTLCKVLHLHAETFGLAAPHSVRITRAKSFVTAQSGEEGSTPSQSKEIPVSRHAPVVKSPFCLRDTLKGEGKGLLQHRQPPGIHLVRGDTAVIKSSQVVGVTVRVNGSCARTGKGRLM